MGSLAGRGHLADNKKGGKVTIKVNEPCVLIGIASLTPRIDYSQGNDWTVDLKTMDARVHNTKAIGKQPAWINYMTAVNETHGNFAAGGSESFMVLNRVYEVEGENEEREINNTPIHFHSSVYKLYYTLRSSHIPHDSDTRC